MPGPICRLRKDVQHLVLCQPSSEEFTVIFTIIGFIYPIYSFSEQLNEFLYGDFILLNEGCISGILDRFSVAGAIMTDYDPCELRGQAIADCDRRVSIWRYTQPRWRAYGKTYAKLIDSRLTEH